MNRVRITGYESWLFRAAFALRLSTPNCFAPDGAPDGMGVEIFDIRGLPFYDGDLEAQDDPEY